MLKINKIYRFLISLFLLLLPFEGILRVVPNIILVILSLLFPFIIKKKHFILYRNRSFVCFVSFCAYCLLLFTFNGTLMIDMGRLSKFFSVIWIFILISPLSTDDINDSKLYLITGVSIVILISLVSILVYTKNNENFSFSVGPQVNSVLLTERVYISFMAVLSFIFSLNLIKDGKLKRTFFLGFFSMILSTVFVFLISARLAISSLIVISFYNVIALKNFKRLLIILTMFTVFVPIIFLFNKNLQNRFFFNDKDQQFVENFIKWEPRVAIWRCVYDISISNEFNKLFGFDSFSETKEALLNCYDKTIDDPLKRKYFIKSQFNTHNQILDVFLATGLIGFFLFFLTFFFLFYENAGNRLFISLFIAFLLLSLVEVFFNRQIGAYLFGFFLSLGLKKSTLEIENRIE